MSRLTKFKISAPKHIIEELELISGYDFDSKCKWWKHEEDIKTVSLKYPTAEFSVTGHEEERDNIWKIYAIGGEIEKVEAIILFPKTTLKPPKITHETIYVTVVGVDIPIEVEYVGTLSDGEKYMLAKNQLKELL